MAYKYPFIPKNLYPAVMFAAKLVREKGTFNECCRIASRYYRVSEDEVRKHLQARCHSGQKGRSHKPFKYFTACAIELQGDAGLVAVSCPQILKATTKENAAKQVRKEITQGKGNESYYERYGRVIREYETREDAISNLRNDYKEYKQTHDMFNREMNEFEEQAISKQEGE